MDKVKASDNGCWEWTACKDMGGYGIIGADGAVKGAHRVMWELVVSEIPSDKCVLHHCDNRGCVKPDHLFLGTHKENSEDMITKGRSAIGSRNGRAKLTDADVVKIRSIKGQSQYKIASMFGIDQTMVGNILRKQNWKHVI